MADGCTLFKYIPDICFHSEKEEEASMNELFCFQSEILPKLENSLQIIHSNKAYPNTCITDLPKIWFAICKITKGDLFAFRVCRYMKRITSGRKLLSYLEMCC